MIERISELKRNAIICEMHEADKKTNSKIGGQPWLPEHINWFYNDPEGDNLGKPLAFLAQFDMKELNAFDVDHILPTNGMLYFFYDFENEPIGCMKKERYGAKVYFYEGDLECLQETDFPDDLDERFCIPEFGLHFTSRYEVPMHDEFIQITQKNIDYYKYNDSIQKTGFQHDSNQEITKILGYADACQGSMLLQCEMIQNGIDCNDFEHLKYREQYIANAGDWILLFQVDTISNSDFELTFGDCGRLYFYIRKEDLKNKRFENSWFVTQCY